MITRPKTLSDLQPLELASRLEEPPAGALRSVRFALERERATARSVPRASALGMIAWLGLGTLAALELDALWRMRSLIRADLHGMGMAGLCVASVAVGALLAMGATQLVLSRGRSGLGVSAPVLRAVAIGVPILNAIPQLFLVFWANRQAELAATRAQVHGWGAPCFVLSLAIAGLFLAVFARQLRGSVVTALGWRSAALGAAAGAWAGVALIVHCPGVDALHLLVGHGLPALLFPLVGLALVRRHVQV